MCFCTVRELPAEFTYFLTCHSPTQAATTASPASDELNGATNEVVRLPLAQEGGRRQLGVDGDGDGDDGPRRLKRRRRKGEEKKKKPRNGMKNHSQMKFFICL